MKKFKFRVLSISTIVFSVLLSSLWASAQVAYTLKDEDVTIGSDGVITECRYDFSANADGTDLTIPSMLGGFEVKGIGDEIFRSNGNITKVNLPEGLTSIGSDAFNLCSSLSTVNFPSSLTSIGDAAFDGCSLTELNLPEGLTSIGEKSFRYCFNLSTVNFPSSLTSIGENAFQGCALTKLNLPEGLTSIENWVFSSCNSLSTVTFPSSLTSIGEWAFSSCSKLSTVTFPSSSSLTSIGESAFWYSGLTELNLPEGLTSIGSQAFQQNSLTELTLPESVTSIGSIAFQSNQLSTLKLPSGLTSIGSSAFSDNQLSTLNLPLGLTSISEYAFLNNNLSTLIFSANISKIGANAFENNELTSVEFTSPSNLTELGSRAFAGNADLSSIVLPQSNYDGVLGYDDGSGGELIDFGASITDFGMSFILKFADSYTLKDEKVEVEDGIITSCTYDFSNSSIIIPDRLDNQEITGIGEDVFSGKGIVSVQLPSTLTTIGKNAFSENNLTSLTLPSSVQMIDEYAFSTNKLTEVIFEENSNLFELGNGAFDDNSNLQSVTLPKDQPDFRGYLKYNFQNAPIGELNPTEGEYIISGDGFRFTVYKAYFSTLEITFNPNGGEGEEVVKTYGINTEQTFAPIFTREGYTLKEWRTTPSERFRGSIKYSTDEQHNVGKGSFTLYAQWEPNEAVITYKDGELTETQSSVTDATVALLDGTVFDREGYTLENWNTEADGSGTMYGLGLSDFSVPAGGITLHLIKTANPAILTYKANYEDATEGDKTQDSNTDQSVMLLGSEAFTRAGYSFSGWNTESDGSGDSFAFENDYMTPSGGMTFYAQWEPNESMLTYYPNYEGTAEVKKEESSFTDAEVTLLGSDAFSRDDYTLSGWSSDPNAQEATYEVGASFTMPVGGADLYAVWALNTDLFYYANYEGGSTEPIEYKSFLGAKVSLGDGVSFVRDDYAISGWNTQANGGEESRYKPGEEYEVPSGGMTFYAEWSMKATLTYHANYEGSSDMQSVESYDKEEVSLGDGVSFVRDGFVLTGWNTQEDGNGDSFGVGDDYMTPLEGMTFYAVWSESATVTFVSNYEESTSEDVVMASYVGEALTLPGETFTRVGYTLTGWNAQSDGLGDSFALGDVYMTLSGGMTFYVVWEANEVALAYNANYEGSTNQDIRQDSRTDESVMLLGSDAFTRAGYTLTSWNTQPDGLGDSFALGVDYVTPSEGMTFYAQWEANEVVLSYNANYEGSTNQDIRQDSRTDESVMLLGSDAFTRAGYTLTSWNTQPDGLGDSFAFEDDYTTPSEGMTFYAVWEKEETVLSLSDELNGSTMQSYPNPVQTMLTVERSKAMRGQVNVRVFNMVGKEVYSKVYGVSDDYMEVDFSALPMGMYFLQMSDENGDSERTRIMKR